MHGVGYDPPPYFRGVAGNVSMKFLFYPLLPKVLLETWVKGQSATSHRKKAKPKSSAKPIEPACGPPALSDFDRLAADLERVMESGALTDAEMINMMAGHNKSVNDPDCPDAIDTVDDELVGFEEDERAIVSAAIQSGDVSSSQVQEAANDSYPDMLPDNAFNDAALSVLSSINPASALDYNVAASVWRTTFERGIKALQYRQSKMTLNIGHMCELALLVQDDAPHPHNVIFVHFHNPDRMLGRKVRIDNEQGAVYPINTTPGRDFNAAAVVVPAIGIKIQKDRERTTKWQRREMPLLQTRPRVPDEMLDLQKMWSTALAIGQGRELNVLDKTCAVCGSSGEDCKLVVCSMCRQSMHEECCHAVMAIREAPHPIDIDLPDVFGRSRSTLTLHNI